MKKQTRAQKYADYADVVKAMREGKPVKRSGTKDRSVPTHPVVPVCEDVPEKYVVTKCISWLRKKRIMCNRNNVGAGQMGTSGYYSYGIRDAGDIVGLLPNGQHLEIETKCSNGGRLSYGQQQRMKKIRESSGIYLVIHGVAELEYYLMKICSKCQRNQLISEFYKHRFTKDGLHSECKNCIKETTQQWRNTIRGHLWGIFDSMKQRCTNPTCPGFKNYGERGIRINFKSHEEFIDYVINELQIDPRGLEIHRINNDGHYGRGNLIFLDPTEHRRL